MTIFRDRNDAGALLSERLNYLQGRDVIVLGLPRGGVPVAAIVARHLGAPLDVLVVRKLGVPSHPELAMGAIAEGGFRLLDHEAVALLGVSAEQVRAVEQREREALDHRVARLRRGRSRFNLAGRTVVIVDDGVATGATARVACAAARDAGASLIVLAVPVIAAQLLTGISEADQIVYDIAPTDFRAVGQFYDDFSATSDDEVVELLEDADRRVRAPDVSGTPAGGSSPDRAGASGLVGEIRSLAQPLRDVSDLDPLVHRVGSCRFVGLGEASHGTHEYYWWRAELSKRLIAERGFRWIGVEGDWPDCWRLNRWVRGAEHRDLSATQVLSSFARWPTWMWANEEVAEFLTWLREWNESRPLEEQVGFYGLDVYSLWDSLRAVMQWLAENAPDAQVQAQRAWQCFDPYGEDPHRYASATRLVPASCEDDVVRLLVEVRSRTRTDGVDESTFDVVQNAEVAAGAERYYRAMVRGDRESWNVRDIHMADTIDRLAAHHGADAKGLIWEHNTHIGDARATDMAPMGMVNVGQLMRERHGADNVGLVGMAAYGGSVIAARAWGSSESVMPVPVAVRTSHEGLLHSALGAPAVLVFSGRGGEWLSQSRGHRAIGVVYAPEREFGNYVPTVLGTRYDALLWFEDSSALRPLHHESRPSEAELETSPTGY